MILEIHQTTTYHFNIRLREQHFYLGYRYAFGSAGGRMKNVLATVAKTSEKF